MKIYFDSCIAIYFVERHSMYASKIEAEINSLSSAQICYSPLSRLECFVMPLRTKDASLQKLYESFFAQQQMLDLPLDVFDAAAQLRADFTGLKTPDAIHLAVALHHGCDEFWTNDGRLSRVAPSMVKDILTT